MIRSVRADWALVRQSGRKSTNPGAAVVGGVDEHVRRDYMSLMNTTPGGGLGRVLDAKDSEAQEGVKIERSPLLSLKENQIQGLASRELLVQGVSAIVTSDGQRHGCT